MISRKGVNREVRSEACPADRIGRGSETAKAGSNEQELDTEAI